MELDNTEMDDTDNDGGEMMSQRAALSRERNREHARRTRIRKKARLQALQGRVNELKQESQLLDECLEDCQTADILRSLSTNQAPPSRIQPPDTLCKSESTRAFQKDLGLRAQDTEKNGIRPPLVQSSPLLQLNNINKCQVVHWKDAYAIDADGKRHVLSDEEMETLRRERNRMHAKMTRDRRKLLVARLEQTVVDLEMSNDTQRATLNHFYGQIADRIAHNTQLLHRNHPKNHSSSSLTQQYASCN